MNTLNLKAFAGLAFLTGVLGLLIFIPAGTIEYWEAWTYLLIFFTSTLSITLYLMKRDPSLLEKRVKAGPTAEKEVSQKVIQLFASLGFASIFIISSLDHIRGWSSVPLYAVAAGDVLVAVGFYAVFLVFRVNTYTSATIEVDEGQKVISTGPYGFVRHPMYSGAFIMLLGTPLALGSIWGFASVLPIFIVIVIRMLEEEKFLLKNLPAYDEYCRKVCFRLIPGVY